MVFADLIVSFVKSEAAKKHSVKVPMDGGRLGKGARGTAGNSSKNFLR